MPTAPPFATLEQQQQDVVISTHILSESLFANSIKILALSSPPVSMIVFHAHFLNLVREACTKKFDVFFTFSKQGFTSRPPPYFRFFPKFQKIPPNCTVFSKLALQSTDISLSCIVTIFASRRHCCVEDQKCCRWWFSRPKPTCPPAHPPKPTCQNSST